jgi:hypothetical protein
MSCPSSQALTQLVEGALPVDQVRAIDKHLAACRRCAHEVASLRELLDDLRKPRTSNVGDDAFVHRVMRDLPAREERARSRPFPRWGWLAAAAVVIMMVAPAARRLSLPGDRREEFQARGGRPGTLLEQWLGVEVLAVREGKLLPLAGASLRSSDGLVVRYTNLVSARPVYLLAFALDAAGDVHWMYPAYLDAAQNPAAVRLAVGARQRLLDQVVGLERPASGGLRIVVVTSFRERRVKEVEALLEGAKPAEPTAPRFPGDSVQEWRVAQEGSR